MPCNRAPPAAVQLAMKNRALVDVLEPRRLFSLSPALPAADLLVDANRDGVITSADDANEATWTNGKSGRGAVVLPNLDRDNTTTGAPDNWTGGVWNGRPVAPNHVIDNAADLLDVGRLRLRKLGVDDAYNYRVTVRVLRPETDPAWFASTPAQDRVRLFFPTKQVAGGDVAAQPGDVAVIGPGLGDTIRFVVSPAAANEYSIGDLAGDGWFRFGVEGIKAGAGVRFQVKVEYVPIIVESSPVGGGGVGGGGTGAPTTPPPSVTDTVALRVAPFVLSDNRQRATKVVVENMNRYGIDNADARAALKQVFGTRLVESRSGDIWQQDGYEIGYVKAPYGAMPIVLELPRARDTFFDQAATMRSFVRGTLLAAGLGVSTDVAALPHDSASAFGGDIESLPRAGGKPGYLLASGMPTKLRSFFAAQGTNPLLDLKLDDWLGVAHVDELVQVAPGGNKALVADADLAWALALWAVKLDPNARGFPKMNGNDQLPGYTADGVKLAGLLSNPTFRKQNLEYAGSATRLRAVHDAVRRAMNLTDEVTAPAKAAGNTGTATLARGGAFARLIGNVKRTFEVRFLDADRYQLRYRDGSAGAYSKWFDGRRSRDEVFPQAKAYLFKHYWTGTPKAGDRFAFATNPSATLVKMPVLFATPGLFFEGSASAAPITGPWRLAPFSTNHVNSVVDGDAVVTGRAYGPRVNWTGRGASDLFQGYADAAFRSAGYTRVVYADARVYHDAGGNLHCGTNVARALPAGKWWEA